MAQLGVNWSRYMELFRTICRAINRIPFILQIILGMCLGVVLALIVPGDKVVVPVCGVLFVSALKAIAPLLVFVLVAAAIARQEPNGSAAKMKPILLLYFISMLLSSMAALCMSYAFPSTFPTLAEAVNKSTPKAVSEVILNVLRSAVDNPINALATGNYIAILVWGVAFGILFRVASSATKDVLMDLAVTVSGVVKFVIRFAPLGVMGLVFSSCTQPGGFSNLLNYLHVVVVLVVTMLFIAFVINPLLVFLMTRRNPYPLVWTCVSSGLDLHCPAGCMPSSPAPLRPTCPLTSISAAASAFPVRRTPCPFLSAAPSICPARLSPSLS